VTRTLYTKYCLQEWMNVDALLRADMWTRTNELEPVQKLQVEGTECRDMEQPLDLSNQPNFSGALGTIMMLLPN
jgi:hypothetical protein